MLRRAQVEELQPYYVFHGQDYKNLQIGSAIILEVLERETKKETEDQRRAERVKAEEDAAKQKVHFMRALGLLINFLSLYPTGT